MPARYYQDKFLGRIKKAASPGDAAFFNPQTRIAQNPIPIYKEIALFLESFVNCPDRLPDLPISFNP
jgi:hypothetical protein